MAELQTREGYLGSRFPDGHVYVGVIEDGAVAYPLPHNRGHSPDGFEWGYAGSGPADLARSILSHALRLEGTDAENIPPALYQEFKTDKIALLPRSENWEISRIDVLRWIAAHIELLVSEPGWTFTPIREESGMSEDTHEIRELKHRLKIANKTMGKQGRTIRALRAELALTREEHSKIDRGALRRLERFEDTAKEQFELDRVRIERAHDEIKRLQEKLDQPKWVRDKQGQPE